MRRIAAAALSLAPLLIIVWFCFTSGCAKKLEIPAAPPPGTAPALHFASPAAGDSVGLRTLLSFTVENFTLDSLGSAPAVGHGHIDVRVDQGAATPVSADTFTVQFAGTGPHTVVAELRGNDDAPLSPPVADSLVVNAGGGGGTAGPTLSGDVEPIFAANCTDAGCHVPPSPQLGEDLSTAAATLATAVNVSSVEAPGKKRIVPGHAEQSYTVDKLEGAGTIIGSRMPLGKAPLSAQQVQTIKDWINAGAKNN